jgi:hypothetical protein
MKKGDVVYITRTVGTVPVFFAYRGTIIYVTKVMNEPRSIRVLVNTSYSFSKGISKNPHKATFSLIVSHTIIYTDKDLFIKTMNKCFNNFSKLIEKSKQEIKVFEED